MKTPKFSKLVVSLVLLLNIIFTVAVFYMFWHVGHEPSALIVAWFGFTTGELWALSKIKQKEVERNGENGN
jgi:hypothetical protein